MAEALGARLYSFPRYDTEIGCTILGSLKGEWSAVDVRAGTDGGGDARRTALITQSLMAIDRYAVASEIEVHLATGIDVVIDRWWPSGYVYGAVDGLDRNWLTAIHARLPRPDAVILLDVSPEESIRRRPERRDRYERDDKMDLRRDCYRVLFSARAARGEPWRVVSGVGAVEDVARAVRQTAEALCGERR